MGGHILELESERLKRIGREEGLEEGMEKGMEKGLEKGLEEGREAGRKEQQLADQKIMAQMGKRIKELEAKLEAQVAKG